MEVDKSLYKDRSFYMVMTNDEELAKEIKQLIDARRKGKWWKLITKYYKAGEQDPYYETSETSTGKKS